MHICVYVYDLVQIEKKKVVRNIYYFPSNEVIILYALQTESIFLKFKKTIFSVCVTCITSNKNKNISTQHVTKFFFDFFFFS